MKKSHYKENLCHDSSKDPEQEKKMKDGPGLF